VDYGMVPRFGSAKTRKNGEGGQKLTALNPSRAKG